MENEIAEDDIKRIFRREIGPISEFERLESLNNHVSKVKSGRNLYICKVYLDRGVCEDMDGYVSEKIQHPALKKLYYFDSSKKEITNNIAILEFIEGRTYKDMLERDEEFDYEMHMSDFYDLVSEMARTKTRKYGYLTPSFEGSHDTWLEFQLNLHSQTVTQLANFTNFDQDFYLSVYDDIVTNFAGEDPEAVLLPMDLNLNQMPLCNRRLKPAVCW